MDRDMIWRFGRHFALVVLVCVVAGKGEISLCVVPWNGSHSMGANGPSERPDGLRPSISLWTTGGSVRGVQKKS